MKFRFALLAAAMALAMPATGQAQMRALSDPVVGHPNPESLFTSPDRKLHRNKQAALHIQRELLKCGQWSRAGATLRFDAGRPDNGDAREQDRPVARHHPR